MFVPKFRGNRSCNSGFRTRQPPCKFGVKSDLSQKGLKYSKKYFIWLYVLRYPFIPTKPLLVATRFFFPVLFLFCSFFSFFFFLNFVRSSSPKPQNIEIQFLCKVVELQMQFFLPKVFRATPPGPPKMGPQKNNFLYGLS